MTKDKPIPSSRTERVPWFRTPSIVISTVLLTVIVSFTFSVPSIRSLFSYRPFLKPIFSEATTSKLDTGPGASDV